MSSDSDPKTGGKQEIPEGPLRGAVFSAYSARIFGRNFGGFLAIREGIIVLKKFEKKLKKCYNYMV